MKEVITKINVGNYRGELHLKSKDGSFYWTVECDFENDDEWQWEPIPKPLYLAILEFEESKSES